MNGTHSVVAKRYTKAVRNKVVSCYFSFENIAQNSWWPCIQIENRTDNVITAEMNVVKNG